MEPQLRPILAVDPPEEVPSAFKRGQRVAVYSKEGGKHYGVVHWTGRESFGKKFDYPVVGIKMVFYNNIIIKHTHTAEDIHYAGRGCLFE